MKTAFGKLLHKFMRSYLPDERGASPRTITTYRYAFIQFIDYMESMDDVSIDNISMDNFNEKNIRNFLRWLEDAKSLSIASTNQRLAALKSFASFAKYEYPEYMLECERIAKIKPKKKELKTVSYLSTEGMGALLSSIDRSSKSGLRDYTMVLLLFLTGIRVSELIGIKCRDVIFSSPRYIVIHGKGNKTRHVPITKELKAQLVKYQSILDFTSVDNYERPLFANHSKNGFTRQGINYTLTKYANLARKTHPELIPVSISPHKIRHSAAMSLVEEGTELIVIRDLLGHSSVQTTEIYAKLSSNRKRAAIEEASSKIVPTEVAQWEESASLKDWLKSFK